jgi:hypothetical protein
VLRDVVFCTQYLLHKAFRRDNIGIVVVCYLVQDYESFDGTHCSLLQGRSEMVIILHKHPKRALAIVPPSWPWVSAIIERYTFHRLAGIAQSVQRLATGWTVRGSNPGGGPDIPHPSRPALGPIQPSIQGVPGLSRE